MAFRALQTKEIKDIFVIKLTKRADIDFSNIKTEYFESFISSGIKKVVFDMEKVTRFYSASISRLVELLKLCQTNDIKLCLMNIPKKVETILNSVNILDKFCIYSSEYDFILDNNLEGVYENQIDSQKEVKKKSIFEVVADKEKDEHTIKINGLLVEDTHINSLFNEIKSALSRGAKNITLDLGNTDFIDSMSISKFVVISRMCKEKNVNIKIINSNELIEDAFKITDVGKLFGL